MGWFGDRTVLVQKPRKSGCLFALLLAGFAVASVLFAVMGTAWMTVR
jgi:hypothetical protein